MAARQRFAAVTAAMRTGLAGLGRLGRLGLLSTGGRRWVGVGFGWADALRQTVRAWRLDVDAGRDCKPGWETAMDEVVWGETTEVERFLDDYSTPQTRTVCDQEAACIHVSSIYISTWRKSGVDDFPS
jgi:hypothetical protein